MRKVLIVTDSSANVPAALVRKLDIRVVPIILAINGHTFQDGVDITPSEVYELQRELKHVPTTAAPSVGDFLKTYVSAAEEASGIVSIHMSPKLSATHSAAFAASRLLEEVPIRVVDCRSAAMGQGFVVLEAARAAATGASLDAVVARAEDVASKVQLLAMVGTLEYLRRSGRISWARAKTAQLLRVKPIIQVFMGEVSDVARTRTRHQATEQLLEMVHASGSLERLAVLHTYAPELETFCDRLREHYPHQNMPTVAATTVPLVEVLYGV